MNGTIHFRYFTVIFFFSQWLYFYPLLALAQSEQQIGHLLGLSLDELLNVPIVTASRIGEKITDTPTTVIVVTRQQILNRRYVNLIDLLQDLPSVDVQRGVEDVRYHNISIRGHQGNNRFLILQDGVRIDSPTGELIAVAENFPLYHAQQVEILYGPAAAVYGADAFGGVINIITQTANQKDGVSLISTFGADNYRHLTVHAGKKLHENVELVVGAHKHHSDTADLPRYYPEDYAAKDVKTFDGEIITPATQREPFLADIDSQSLFAKLVLAKSLTLGYQGSFFRSLTSVGVRPETTLFSHDAQWNTDLKSVYLNYNKTLNDHLSSQTRLEYASFKASPQSRFNNIFTHFDSGYKYSEGDKRSIEQQFNYLINDDHRLVSGFSFEEFYSLPRTADLPSAYNPRVGVDQQHLYYPNTNDELPIVILDDEYRNYAVYADWKARWNEQWSSNVGVRFDRNSRYGNTINPRLGVVYQPTEDLWFKALYGKAFRAPSVFETLATFGSFSGERNAQGEYISDFFRAPNPDLAPEKSRHYELSVSYGLQKNLRLGLAAYYTEVDNLIQVRNSDYPIQFIPGGHILRTTIRDNLGTKQQYGFDLLLNYQRKFSSGFAADFWGSYSYLDGESCCTNGIASNLPFVAQHKLKLGTTFSYQDRYFITPKIYWIGDTNTNKLDPNDRTRHLQSEGYVVMDVHFGIVRVAEQLSFNIDIYNVFDRRYTHAGGESSTTFIGTPQAPRTWLFSLRYDY
ncbi:TonB-dependent receptor plug domain-containing protein [Thioflexithrix psekupsensis]|uniref:TonB-dependent receptor n=1 Tax=Thioflexithrix psekupsensis TaxID=1570016 RepID=A0A251X564_9GAMM|nr:TonB-dependent receptor [Thioflexithrix psekupsensis]OUD12561.1 hypothetical protein TPSD3_15875 [Thioflexithrix psekupsensis]